MPVEKPRTLTAGLSSTALQSPLIGISIFDSRGRTGSRRTYPEVLAVAEHQASLWRQAGLRPGDLVLIARPTSWEWLDAWFGAVFLGAIPLAVAPARGFGTSEADYSRVEALVRRFEPRVALVGDALREQSLARPGDRLSTVAITSAMLAAGSLTISPGASTELEGAAFLQLTGGTNGRPLAVPVSHAASIHNAFALNDAVNAPGIEPDGIVSWLPLHHDMGLVGALLLAILTGRELKLLPPAAFLARPAAWLEHIAGHQCALSLAPNFAFDHCCSHLGGLPASLDLSGWGAAICGAEMISPQTMARFAATFESRKFVPGALRAGYGLAEATVAVTLDQVGRGIRSRAVQPGMQPAVCVGAPVHDTRVCVRAPDGSNRRDDKIGEVFVRGPGVFHGYYRDEESTKEILQGGWLRTGDLGFTNGGELYLTGRSKDVLIMRGEKLMPQELEWIAEGMDFGVNRAAAFSLPSQPGEQAILIVESQERDPAVLLALDHEIRARIGDSLALTLADLVFVPRGRIPRTTSGKLQRATLREMYQQGRLERSR